MKTKIANFVAAATITATLFFVTPMAPIKAAPMSQKEAMQTIIAGCASAFSAYRHGDNMALLNKLLAQVPETSRPAVELTCMAYAKGYYDSENNKTVHIV
jgi:hypothetical protein